MHAILVASLLIALPPPICRGKVYDRYDPALDKTPTDRAIAEVKTAYEVLCPKHDCGSGTLYQNFTVGMNALTWVSGIRDGQQTRAKIVYGPEFLDALAKSFGAGASFGVLAHEVGHHLTAALSMRKPMESSWDEELRADYLAGCALGASGHPPDALENALRALASVASSSHPSFQLRNPVIRKGYEECSKTRIEMDRKKPDKGFGVGVRVKKDSRSTGCWSYFYREPEEVARIGPIAAKRHRSRSFETQESCERARDRTKKRGATAQEPCSCL